MAMKITKSSTDKIRVDFLPEALEIIEKPASPLGHIMIWVITALVLAAILWASFGKMEEDATARGKIAAVDGIQKVQALKTGTVREINVKEGDYVKAGEVLYVLDQETDEAFYNNCELGHDVLELKIAMLQEALAGKDLPESALSAESDDEMAAVEYIRSLVSNQELALQKEENQVKNCQKAYLTEKKKLNALQRSMNSLLEQQSRMEKHNQKESAEMKKLSAMKNKRKKIEKELKEYRELYREDVITRSELEEKKAELEELKDEITVQEAVVEDREYNEKEKETELTNQIHNLSIDIEIQQSVVESADTDMDNQKLALKQLKVSNRAQLTNLLDQYSTELRQQENTLLSSEDSLENCRITAPCDGMLKSSNVNTVGSVVSASELLAEIVPEGSQLIMEAQIPNQDIGYVKTGQSVGIKLDTFHYQKYGKWLGTVIYVAPDAVATESDGMVYKVNIAIEENSLGISQELATGMSGTVEVKTGERRIIEFFLEPLTDYLDKGLKVR